MPREFSSWNATTRENGYNSEREMLEDLYEKSGISIRALGIVLGKPYATVKYRLEMHGFRLRSRGGPNHTREDE